VLPIFLAATPLSLKEVEAIAMKSGPLVQLAQHDVKQYNYQKLQALVSWMPEIKFGSMYAKLQKSQKISSHQRQTHLFSNQFELIQPLFAPNLLADLNLSKLAYEGALVAKEMTINEMLFQIRSLYLKAVIQQKTLQVERQVIAYLKMVYDEERRKYAMGSGTTLQVTQAKAALSEKITGYYNTLKSEADATEQLTVMLHIDPKAVEEITLQQTLNLDDYPLLAEKLSQLRGMIQADMTDPTNLDKPLDLFSEDEVHHWVMVAHQNRPELKQSQLYVKAAQEKSRESKSQYLPTISAFADYGYYQPVNGQFFKQRNDFAGGIQLSWSLFDSFKREAKVLEIRALEKGASLALKYASNRVDMTIRSDLYKIKENLLTFLSADDNLRLAALSLDETRTRLSSGSATELDLQNSLQLHALAELRQQQAECSLLESYFHLRYDAGSVEL
jgi:outer membrane protein TolC